MPLEIGVVGAVRRKLTEAGRVDTPEAAIALRLATLLDDAGQTASGYASLSKELRAAMDAALQGAGGAADVLDELMRKRRERATRGA